MPARTYEECRSPKVRLRTSAPGLPSCRTSGPFIQAYGTRSPTVRVSGAVPPRPCSGTRPSPVNQRLTGPDLSRERATHPNTYPEPSGRPGCAPALDARRRPVPRWDGTLADIERKSQARSSSRFTWQSGSASDLRVDHPEIIGTDNLGDCYTHSVRPGESMSGRTGRRAVADGGNAQLPHHRPGRGHRR